jgi:D-aminopeptidase
VRTRRAMDAPAPGDWTLQVQRALGGKVSGVMLGCWLARRIEYQKTN